MPSAASTSCEQRERDWLRGTLDTPMKRYDLMQDVNTRGSFLCAQACLPYLLRAPNPHILALAPPPSLDPRWGAAHGVHAGEGA